MKHITFTTSKWLQMRIAVFFLLGLLCICLPTDSHAQTNLENIRHIADSLTNTAKYDEAIYYRTQEKNIIEIDIGKNSWDYAKVLYQLGHLYGDKGCIDTAITLTEFSLKAQEKNLIEDSLIYAQSIYNLGTFYRQKDNVVKANECDLKSLAIYQQKLGKNHPDYIVKLIMLGVSYHKIGEIIKSIQLFNMCVELQAQYFGTENLRYALMLNNIGMGYSDIGQYEKGIEYLKKAYCLSQKIGGSFQQEHYAYLGNIAQSYHYWNKDDSALLYYNKCIYLNQHLPITTPKRNYGSVLIRFGKFQMDLRNYSLADSLLRDGYKICEEYFDVNNMYQALNNCGRLSIYKGKYQEALDFYAKAEAIRLKYNFSRGKPTSYIGIAIINWRVGKMYYSNQLFSNINTIQYQYFNEQSIGFSENQRNSFWNRLKDFYETYHSFCRDAKDSLPEVVAQAYNNQLNTAGILLQGTEKVKQAIQSSGDSSLLQLYERWRIQKKQIANWTTWDSLRLANSGIDLKAETEKANDWEQELARKSVEFREATDTTAITWQQVQQSLQAGEAAVEIVRFRKYHHDFTDTVYYAALVLTPETKENPIYVFLPNGNKMDSLWFKKYREYIGRHNPNYPLKTEDTISYVRYLKPILAACGNAKHIYFAADGVYHKLNFNTLWTEQGQYVAQQWQIHQLSSTRELVKKHSEIPVSTQFTAALFGNPTFDMNKAEWLQATNSYHQTETASTFRGGLEGDREENLANLPGAEAEVEAIGELLKNKGFEVKSYLNKMALEEEVQALKSPTIVLFATHGSFQKKASLPKSTGYNIANDPMYQSVLFFAGAKNTLSDSLSLENILATPQHEDGILHAAEAANLRLEGTELVVLSACETGLGQIQNGEGVYGLQRAFRIAGAKDLLMSLWKVDDQASKEFTTLFFQNWIDKKMAKYEAYRSTQLTLIQKYPHEPKKWGAFVLKESGR